MRPLPTRNSPSGPRRLWPDQAPESSGLLGSWKTSSQHPPSCSPAAQGKLTNTQRQAPAWGSLTMPGTGQQKNGPREKGWGLWTLLQENLQTLDTLGHRLPWVLPGWGWGRATLLGLLGDSSRLLPSPFVLEEGRGPTCSSLSGCSSLLSCSRASQRCLFPISPSCRTPAGATLLLGGQVSPLAPRTTTPDSLFCTSFLVLHKE